MPLIAGGLLAVALVGGGAWYLTRDTEPPPPAEPAPVADTRPAPTKKAPRPAATESPAPAAPERRAAPEKVEGAAPAPAADTSMAEGTVLVIDTDVPGASVFVDREFVGNSPVTLKGVTPGTKRVNVSAEGFEGVQKSVDVTQGENSVTLRFKEVRLNASVGVAHKHGMGGCEGTLRATIDGLSYETSNKNDAFSLPYAQVETFEINYLDKNLRVKQRGGKTWNFTDKAADNADKLFVFHRDVTAAREKLSKGFTAAR